MIILTVTNQFWFLLYGGFFFKFYFIVPPCGSTLSLCKRTETTAMINTSSSRRSLWVLTLKPNYVNLSVGIVNLFSAIHFNKTAVFPTITGRVSDCGQSTNRITDSVLPLQLWGEAKIGGSLNKET